MKKYWKKVPAAILALLLVVSLLPVTAFAAEGLTVRLPVSVTETAEEKEDIPAGEFYRFRLTALNGAPMPEEGGILDVKGPGEASFSPIVYSKVGVYEYTLSMTPGDHPRGTYDTTVYNVKVTVENDGAGLKSTVAMRKQGGDLNEKCGEAAFTVAYSPVMKDITVKKLWEDGGHYHPSYVEVSLLVDDQVVETATLNARNNWTYTFEQLVQKRDNSWKIQEKTIRGKYVAKYAYDYEESFATVTNTYTTDLIQTGQLNWPIPVLCSLGAVLVILGVYFIFKKRDDACA